MKKMLLVIDFQNAFINHNTIKAKADIPELIKSGEFDEVLFTRFINNKESPVYKKLNWQGCIDEKSRNICIDINGYDVIDKDKYSAFGENICEYIKSRNIEEIYLCGIDIECCVLVTAFNFFENGYDIYVLKDFVYCTEGEKRKNNALDILSRNIGSQNIL